VKRRNRQYEHMLHGQASGTEYLAKLADAYTRFFYHYEEAPVLVVNSEHLNFVEDERDFRLLVDRIDSMRGRREMFGTG
jgi:deoxyguanosine kinase